MGTLTSSGEGSGTFPHGGDSSLPTTKFPDDLPAGANHEQKDSMSIVEFSKDSSLDHLSESEKRILSRELYLPPVNITYRMLFRYASKVDLLIIAICSVCAIISGAVMPLMTVVFGQFAGTFRNFAHGTVDKSYFHDNLNRLTLYFLYLGIGQFVTSYVLAVGFMYTGEHATQKLRAEYLAAILRQNIAFFDKMGAGEITTTITSNMDLVQLGISEKVGLAITGVSTFVAALIVGFVVNWRLACVLLSVVAAMILIAGSSAAFIVKFSKASLSAYSIGSAVAEEGISSIRTAQAFNGQKKLSTKYERSLMDSMHWGFRMKCAVGFMIAAIMAILQLNYGLSFWEGSRLLVAGYSNVAHTLTVLLSMLMAAVSIHHVMPHLRAFGEAVAAAENIFKIIDRPLPNTTASTAVVPTQITGAMEFRGIKHIYPSRPEVTVLEDFNLTVPAGKVTALVGSSGSGKSTIVGLIERFYIPVDGQVLLDSHDIQTMDLKWLRRQMSLVSQQPVIFNCSIRANIEHGLIGTEHEHIGDEKKNELIVQAAKMANAHDFISGLPQGYETIAGDRGLLLSGGQKQRIAIARAVISNPKILLLDEATSALDSQSERVVQAALDVAVQGRTTIVVAHRLSTIKRADNIVVLSKGRIVEQGTHDDLISRRGVYFDLVEAQSFTADKNQHNIEQKYLDNNSSFTKELVITHTARSIHSSYKQALDPAAHGSEPNEPQDSLWAIIKFISAFNRQELGIMFVGLFFSILAGGGMPVQGVLFAKCIISLSLPPSDYVQLRSDVNFWSLMFLVVGISIFFVTAGHGVAFAYCSERLIYRARDLGFRSILRQDILFFDQDINSTGALTSSLSKGANDLAGISGATLGAMLNLVTTIVTAITISCIIGWKLALVCSSTIPILLLCGFIRFWILARFAARAGKAYEASASIACEAVSAVPTIASLSREQDVWNIYHNMLKAQLSKSLQSIFRSSLLFAAAQSLALLCMALGFWYGGGLILAGEYSMFQFFVCFNAVIFSAQSAGALFSFAPDMAKSRHAAQQLKNLCDRVPEIDSWSEKGERMEKVDGKIEFNDVHFAYPSRGIPVLRGLNLSVKPGQFIALVGASGCGKSTAISLIERFYNLTSGQILVDGKDISTLKVKEYRSHIALVSQEPVMYSGTVRENIVLGIEDDVIEEEKVIEACKKANIYDFIESLPQGLSTPIGPKGALLSGGQKQRLALARALLLNPKILLLDEATSALDSESEKVVQEALDEASKERTTIAVAHRLSTIQGADRIFVFEDGQVVEEGSHRTLIERRGRYWEMARLQRLGV